MPMVPAMCGTTPSIQAGPNGPATAIVEPGCDRPVKTLRDGAMLRSSLAFGDP